MSDTCCRHCGQIEKDHDIVIRIDTNLTNFIEGYHDHEKRLRRIEFYGAPLILGVMIFIESVKEKITHALGF